MRLSVESFEPWKTLGSLLLNNKKIILGSAVVLTAAAAIYRYYQNNAALTDNSQQRVIPQEEPALPPTETNSGTISVGDNSNATFGRNSNRSIIAVNSRTGSEEEIPLGSTIVSPQ